MNPIELIRHANFLQLLEEIGGTKRLADLYECEENYLSQIKNRSIDSESGRPKSIGSRVARKLERLCQKPKGWLDTNHQNQDQAAGQSIHIRRIVECLQDLDIETQALIRGKVEIWVEQHQTEARSEQPQKNGTAG